MNIREVYVSAGAGFVVVLTGAIMTMPGLPKNPAAYSIDVTDDGVWESACSSGSPAPAAASPPRAPVRPTAASTAR